MEEGEDSNTLDFEEFKVSMTSFGIDEHFDEKTLHKIFTHFVQTQSTSLTSKHLHKRKELNINLFIKYLGNEVQNHITMQPKEILDAAYRQLLEKGIEKTNKGSHKNILLNPMDLGTSLSQSATPENSADIDLNKSNKPNPYLDGDFIDGITKEYGQDKIAKFEAMHSVKDLTGLMVKEEAKIAASPKPPNPNGSGIDLFATGGTLKSNGNGKPKLNGTQKQGSHGKLVRMESSRKWGKDEMDKQEEEMKKAFQLLAQQHDTAGAHKELSDSMGSTPRIGIIHEDQDIE